jgi:hypothetical protein
MVNETWIPSPNEAAIPLIDPEVLNNPFIYPRHVDLKHAEFYAVISPMRFLTAREQAGFSSQ